MNTTANVRTVTSNTTVSSLQMPLQARMSSLTMAALLTLAMLAGVNTLAGDSVAAPQMAQTSAPRA